MRAHVVCPACRAGLDFEVPDDYQLMGAISVMDVGSMEVTMPYDEAVADHLNKHRDDGTLWEATRKHYKSVATEYASLAVRFGWDDADPGESSGS